MPIIDPVAYSQYEKMYLTNAPITIQRAFSLEIFSKRWFLRCNSVAFRVNASYQYYARR